MSATHVSVLRNPDEDSSDQAPRATAATTPATSGPSHPLDPQGKAREFAAACLEEDAVEEGLLGAANGRLLETFFQTHAKLQDVLRRCQSDAEFLKRQQGTLDTILSVCRQIDRFANVRNQIASRRERAQSSRPR